MNLNKLPWALALIVLFCSFKSIAQNFKPINYTITDISKSTANLLGTPQIQANEYRVVQMDVDAIFNQMQGVMFREDPTNGFIAQLSLPHPDGSMHLYNAKANQTMHPGLAAQFPGIKSYDAAGVNNRAKVKWDITMHGFHAMIMLPDESTIFIDPLIKGNTDYYIVYHKKDFTTNKLMNCSFTNGIQPKSNNNGVPLKTFASCELRTYNVAIAATGEYTIFHGGTVAQAQAAQVTTMNRVNGVYERDMAITMTIVANNNSIIYTNTNTDPYTNGTPNIMINQCQTDCDNNIGSGNYDIGHVFGTNSGGLAGLGVVCLGGQKGRGVTGSAAPIGDPFDIDYVCHEMGHQFGASHTFNNSCGGNISNATAMEPGSGSTIMAYAGICPPDVQSNSHDYFHGISLQQIGNHISSNGCQTSSVLGNSAPTITGTNANVTVPSGTPFALTATANDPDGDVLTYTWEQMDNQSSPQPPQANSTSGPNFRSFPPSNSPTRYFPNLADLAAGNPTTWEVVPTVSRTMNFRVVVRDQSLGTAGCSDHTDVTLSTDANSGPFVVTYPSATGITWPGLSSQTVTWDVSGTDLAPVSCTAVNILLSTDGGTTYPTVLATGVPNDGSETISVPNVSTTTARIMVISSNETFFDISDNNFTITAATNDYSLGSSTPSVSVCQGNDAIFTIDVGSVGGFNNAVNLSASGVPTGGTPNFSSNPVTPAGTSTFTVSNTASITPGTYTITITGNSTTGTKTTNLTLIVSAATPTAVTQTAPANSSNGISIPTTFTWSTAPEPGVTYDIDIATDAGFTNIIDQTTGLTNPTYSSTALASGTTYYWRVRSSTGCGQSAWATTFDFTTSNCNTYTSSDVGQSTDVASFTSTINVTATGNVSDVNIASLNITHPWIGDLGASLTSPNGTTVQLFDGPGIPASTYGCGENNIQVSFDDGAASTSVDFENTCGTTNPSISGPYQSIDALNGFNGESITGTWTLTVFDSYTSGDHGTLDAWSLELCTTPPTCTDPDMPVISGGGSISCSAGAQTLSITSGNLNDATNWQWYTGSCGGTSIGSGASINVTPTSTTTYFVRGEGGCVTPGACNSVTITVTDNTAPTFSCPPAQTICSGIVPDLVSGISVTDDCDASPSIVQSPTAGSSFSGSVTITLTATDATGNNNSCTVDITQANPYTGTESQSICAGQSYNFGSQTLTTAGSYTETFTGSNGCDSTVTLTLSVNPSYNETVSQTICSGDSYTLGSQTLTSAGLYTETFTASSGCDSIVALTLTVIAPYTGSESLSICTGQSYTFGSQTLTSAGNYSETFTANNGCDSTVNLTLTVVSSFNETAQATICQGESYTFGSQTLNADGQYTETFTSTGGCDSTVTLTLNITSIDINTSQNGSTISTVATADSYQWINCDNNNLPISGATNQSFTPSATGNYAVILTVGNCSDTSACVSVDVTGLESLEGGNILIYPNPTTGQLILEWDSNVQFIEVTDSRGRIFQRLDKINGQSTQLELRDCDSGVYFIHIVDERGRHVHDVIKQ